MVQYLGNRNVSYAYYKQHGTERRDTASLLLIILLSLSANILAG